MKFKSILLAGTGLLALVGATATVNKVATSSLSLTDNDVRIDDNSDIAHAPLEPLRRWMAVDEATMVGEAHPGSIVSNRAEADVHTAGAVPGPVPCVLCVVARNICKQQCATPGACDDACDCYNKFNNRNCKDCKIPCGCGHTCPRLEPLQSRMVMDEATEIDSPHPASVAAKGPKEDTQTAGPPARPPPPCLNCQPPPVPCTLCQISLNTCKLNCATPGACDDSCNCWHKRHNSNCKGCSNVPCGCKASCSKLDPLQRRTDVNDNVESPYEPRSNSSDQSDPGAIQGPDSALSVPSPIGGCIQCTLSIGNCQNNCATPGACDDVCNCYFLKRKACKNCGLPCKCGHTCPRLALVQRREITEIPTTEDIQHCETVPNTGAAGVPNPCVVCRTGIQARKNKCNGDSKCENNCDCGHKNLTRQCKECSIPCNSLVPRQHGPSDAKGEDVTSSTNNEAPEQLGEFLPPLDDCMRFAWDCRKACPTPGACDDACNCYYRRKPMCRQWGHKLPCDCGHTCPRLAPAQRRDDI